MSGDMDLPFVNISHQASKVEVKLTTAVELWHQGKMRPYVSGSTLWLDAVDARRLVAAGQAKFTVKRKDGDQW